MQAANGTTLAVRRPAHEVCADNAQMIILDGSGRQYRCLCPPGLQPGETFHVMLGPLLRLVACAACRHECDASNAFCDSCGTRLAGAPMADQERVPLGLPPADVLSHMSAEPGHRTWRTPTPCTFHAVHC